MESDKQNNMNDCCKTMQKVAVTKQTGSIKTINVHKTKVRYQTPECRSLTQMHIVVIGNPREFLVRGVVSL